MIFAINIFFAFIFSLNIFPGNGVITPTPVHKYLYVAVPGIRNYLDYGGHGIVVYDIENNYKFVKRIPTQGLGPDGKPSNVKGICVSTSLQSIYVTTILSIQRIDIKTEKVLWEKFLPEGFDRLEISPDGFTIYAPSFEKDLWNIINAKTGEIIDKITPKSAAHNTIYGANGKEVYLAGLKSPYLTVVNPKKIKETHQIGPFSNFIRPFTVNGKQTLVYVNVNELLGFEIGDLRTGKMLYSVQVKGFQKGEIKRHGCPSHGIGLTPNEEEVWVVDGANSAVHVFDNTKLPPIQKETITLRDQPGWITFTLDGKSAILSTGEIIDTKTKKISATLQDENGKNLSSEKVVEIHISNQKAIKNGSQFGVGRLY